MHLWQHAGPARWQNWLQPRNARSTPTFQGPTRFCPSPLRHMVQWMRRRTTSFKSLTVESATLPATIVKSHSSFSFLARGGHLSHWSGALNYQINARVCRRTNNCHVPGHYYYYNYQSSINCKVYGVDIQRAYALRTPVRKIRNILVLWFHSNLHGKTCR